MVMRATKVFTVIVYDICDNKRRYKIAKLLRQYGSPVNLSVFECMLTETVDESYRNNLSSD